jgi:hypothetical protein
LSSTKQKLNTSSSKETEIVGADDFMLAICWTRYFIEAQGYQVQDNTILFQDNKTAILVEKNGKASSSKGMKHINIQYFFTTDQVKVGNVSLVWCPSGDMISDFMTKPLQGALFRKFQDQMMGVVPAQDPSPGKPKPGNGELDTHKVQPRKGKTVKGSLVLLEKERHHRSVLGVVSKWTKDGRSKLGPQSEKLSCSRALSLSSHFYQLF